MTKRVMLCLALPLLAFSAFAESQSKGTPPPPNPVTLNGADITCTAKFR